MAESATGMVLPMDFLLDTTAQEDAKKLAEETAKKAAEEAAKAANPFQVVNPLENVELNPFEKTKKILNPFE